MKCTVISSTNMLFDLAKESIEVEMDRWKFVKPQDKTRAFSFKMCVKYLAMSTRELKFVGTGYCHQEEAG